MSPMVAAPLGRLQQLDAMNRESPTRSFAPSLMHDLARFIEARCDEPMTLAMLAKEAQLSPSHLQRCFKEVIGVTPKAYHESSRLRKFRHHLRQRNSVTEAIYESGFGSPSRVYERLDSRLGMTPAQYRAGGRSLQISHASSSTPLGEVLIGATDRGICFLQFGDKADDLLSALEREFPQASIHPMSAGSRQAFDRWMSALSVYLRGEAATLDLPLDIRGTAFQIKVWKYLQSIPRGVTLSYAELAKAIGSPGASRAVASACARNNVAIAIPCHRVIRGNGKLAGYRWGIERKQALLHLEQG